ncbi:hypothetical protein N7462_004937 [Penicillium macrosclerotiorum]|uniref:uncharacterized protein n=1 Tax=Penicillium macrosclerotiorum TaxID=303699 RepID=UPI00254915B7|nr:uncharacterized protein N7462_004937 [Penicillium macrosclerotiorum]KAJ5690545.1 hypothetical protein N7462_004937 [Penicillium macrosclerotiorum]
MQEISSTEDSKMPSLSFTQINWKAVAECCGITPEAARSRFKRFQKRMVSVEGEYEEPKRKRSRKTTPQGPSEINEEPQEREMEQIKDAVTEDFIKEDEDEA